MAQMCGATAIKYYLPTVFLALGLSKDLSLMASGIESTLKIGCTIIEMLIIDKLGRKKTLLLGCAIMSLAMIVSQQASQPSLPFDFSREFEIQC
jgi:MFS family permease